MSTPPLHQRPSVSGAPNPKRWLQLRLQLWFSIVVDALFGVFGARKTVRHVGDPSIAVGRGNDRVRSIVDACIITLIVLNIAAVITGSAQGVHAAVGAWVFASGVFSAAVVTLAYGARFSAAAELSLAIVLLAVTSLFAMAHTVPPDTFGSISLSLSSALTTLTTVISADATPLTLIGKPDANLTLTLGLCASALLLAVQHRTSQGALRKGAIARHALGAVPVGRKRLWPYCATTPTVLQLRSPAALPRRSRASTD